MYIRLYFFTLKFGIGKVKPYPRMQFDIDYHVLSEVTRIGTLMCIYDKLSVNFPQVTQIQHPICSVIENRDLNFPACTTLLLNEIHKLTNQIYNELCT